LTLTFSEQTKTAYLFPGQGAQVLDLIVRQFQTGEFPAGLESLEILYRFPFHLHLGNPAHVRGGQWLFAVFLGWHMPSDRSLQVLVWKQVRPGARKAKPDQQGHRKGAQYLARHNERRTKGGSLRGQASQSPGK